MTTRSELAAELRAWPQGDSDDYTADLIRRAADALAWPVGDVYRHERPEVGDWLEIELTGEVRANGWVEARVVGAGALEGHTVDPDHRGVIECPIAVSPEALGRSWLRVNVAPALPPGDADATADGGKTGFR
jgi:hypothetical protein